MGRDDGVIATADILEAKVLIVDDLPADVLLLKNLLRGAGYVSVASTLDSRAVCELHRRNRFDLIVLDLQMPVMDGFAVMDGLREIEAEGCLPVLVVTAWPDHRRRALGAGASDFLSKPFALAEVLQHVHDSLESRLAARELASAGR